MWFSIFCITTLAYMATTDLSFLTFEALVSGVVAIAGLFLAGNVTTKWVAGRFSPPLDPKEKPVEPESSPSEESPR